MNSTEENKQGPDLKRGKSQPRSNEVQRPKEKRAYVPNPGTTETQVPAKMGRQVRMGTIFNEAQRRSDDHK